MAREAGGQPGLWTDGRRDSGRRVEPAWWDDDEKPRPVGYSEASREADTWEIGVRREEARRRDEGHPPHTYALHEARELVWAHERPPHEETPPDEADKLVQLREEQLGDDFTRWARLDRQAALGKHPVELTSPGRVKRAEKDDRGDKPVPGWCKGSHRHGQAENAAVACRLGMSRESYKRVKRQLAPMLVMSAEERARKSDSLRRRLRFRMVLSVADR